MIKHWPKMDKCPACNWSYPVDMLNQMFVGTSIPEDKKHIVIEESPVTKPICGICALEISNTIHGDTRTSFTGPGAESCRVRAIAWRRMHPEIGPTNGENKAVSH